MLETFSPIVDSFFAGMGLQIDSIHTTMIDEDTISVEIQTPDSPLLIGIHGANLSALTHLLSRLAATHFDRHISVRLEVNDYLKSKESRLTSLLDQKILSVMKTGKEAILQGLSSYERKFAHHYISEKSITGLRTYSQGDGAARLLHIASDGVITSHLLDSLSEEGVGI